MLLYGYDLLGHAKNYNKLKFTFISAVQDFIWPQHIKYLTKAYYFYVERCLITLSKLNVCCWHGIKSLVTEKLYSNRGKNLYWSLDHFFVLFSASSNYVNANTPKADEAENYGNLIIGRKSKKVIMDFIGKCCIMPEDNKKNL